MARYEFHSVTHIENPNQRSNEDCNGGFAYIGEFLGSY